MFLWVHVSVLSFWSVLLHLWNWSVHTGLALCYPATEVLHQHYFSVYQTFILLRFSYKLFVFPEGSRGMYSFLILCLISLNSWKILIVAFFKKFQFQKKHSIFPPSLEHHQVQRCHKPKLVSTLFVFLTKLICVSCCPVELQINMYPSGVYVGAHTLKVFIINQVTATVGIFCAVVNDNRSFLCEFGFGKSEGEKEVCHCKEEGFFLYFSNCVLVFSLSGTVVHLYFSVHFCTSLMTLRDLRMCNIFYNVYTAW